MLPKMFPNNSQFLFTAIGAGVCLAVGFIVGFTSRGMEDTDPEIDRAICSFGDDQPVSGYIRFARRLDGRIFIHGNVSGMEGPHGVHIHEFGNLGDKCRAAGGHFNPFFKNHGGRESGERHLGDFGNIAFVNQTAQIVMEDDVDILSGVASVVGRSVVIHQGPDDLGLGNNPSSAVNGRSGPRLACCIIAIERS